MRTAKVQPPAGPGAVTVDWCGQCGGMWLDAGEAERVCPTFANLDRRHVEITALGAQGVGIAKCPRCEAAPFEFRILDLLIDYCGGCKGVWLDAAEHEGRTLGEETELASAGPYRAVQRAAETQGTRCVGCGDEAELANMFMTSHGLACRRCYAAAVTRAAGAKLVEEAEAPVVTQIIGALRDWALAAAEERRQRQMREFENV